MATKLNISFKNTNADASLLNEVNRRRDKSNFIKECIEFYLAYHGKLIKVIEEEPKPVEKVTEVKKDGMDQKAKNALKQFFMEDDD